MSRPLSILVFGAAAALLSCAAPRTGPGPARPAAPPGARSTATGPAAPAAPPPGALLPVDGIACGGVGCVYHPGARGYFACLSGGAGTCFHFGAPCAPADSCLFDAADRRYKHCDQVVEGTCVRWGATCAPASACFYNPSDQLHHHCDAIKDGACARWGALCTPTSG